MNQLTVQAWSESVGISRQAGYAAIARCNIPVQAGKVDADVATVLYRKRTRVRTNERRSVDGAYLDEAAAQVGTGCSSGEGARPDGGEGYQASRARREQAEAAIAELKLAELRRELVRADEVTSRWAGMLSGFRQSLLQRTPRLTQVLAAETDPARVAAILEADVIQALAQLATRED